MSMERLWEDTERYKRK